MHPRNLQVPSSVVNDDVEYDERSSTIRGKARDLRIEGIELRGMLVILS